ncbi:hypothetical protein ACIA8R_29760 [Nonomuraea sp. NPDC051191]|uniref:hypothetical protein n=1 Tax=Nonomuraea sp. NPDC051191 TaxID=3364372 RepID=UPI00378A1EEB
MSDSLYSIGDEVEFVRRGVITAVDQADPAWFGVGQRGSATVDAWFRTDDDSVRHTLVTAVQWPPLPGDTWTDGTGKDWFAHAAEDDGHGLALTSEFGARFEDKDGLKRADELYGPFRLKTPGKQRLEQGSSQ